MGLKIRVGQYAGLWRDGREAAEVMDDDLAAITRLLAADGHHPHDEPVRLPPLHYQAPGGSLPYDYLHRLRRFWARRRQEPHDLPPPVGPDEDPVEDPVLAEEYAHPSSHLCCHSDNDGYYVPTPFTRLMVDPAERLTGLLLGSTQKVFTELEQIADPLEIGYDGDLVSRRTLTDIRRDIEEKGPYAVERLTWLTLYDACRLSLQHSTLISFL